MNLKDPAHLAKEIGKNLLLRQKQPIPRQSKQKWPFFEVKKTKLQTASLRFSSNPWLETHTTPSAHPIRPSNWWNFLGSRTSTGSNLGLPMTARTSSNPSGSQASATIELIWEVLQVSQYQCPQYVIAMVPDHSVGSNYYCYTIDSQSHGYLPQSMAGFHFVNQGFPNNIPCLVVNLQ